MRAYFFGNMYLSSIQQGIQALHVVSDMFVKYQSHQPEFTETKNMLYEWAEDHKTVVLLNAGYSESIRELIEFFNHPANPYPFCEFYEDGAALDGALTSIGIILPKKIYESAKLLRETKGSWREFETGWGITFVNVCDSISFSPYQDLNPWEVELATKLNTFSLAR